MDAFGLELPVTPVLELKTFVALQNVCSGFHNQCDRTLTQLCYIQFMHHVDPMGLIHSQRVGMMHKCSPGE